MPKRETKLIRDEILTGLEKIKAFLEGRGVRGEICIREGACLCLAFAARNSTKDIDAVFEPGMLIRKAAFEAAAEMGWDWNWLNDDVKGFLSSTPQDYRDRLEFPELSHLKVFVPKPGYLLAMKILSARLRDEEEPSTDLANAI